MTTIENAINIAQNFAEKYSENKFALFYSNEGWEFMFYPATQPLPDKDIGKALNKAKEYYLLWKGINNER